MCDESMAQLNCVSQNIGCHAFKMATMHSSFFLLLNPQAVALFCIRLALCALNEWCVAFSSRDAFLNADGMVPRKVLLDANQDDIYRKGGTNIWMAASMAEAVLTLLVVQLLFSISLLMGYHSRVCSLVLSLFNNLWILQNETKMGGGLEVLMVFLLWGEWLPLGDSYSLDALGSHNRRNARNKCVSSGNMMLLDAVEWTTEALVALHDHFASVVILLHLAVMYYCCGVAKETKHWKNGNAVLFVVNSGMPTNQPFASIMASLPMLC